MPLSRRSPTIDALVIALLAALAGCAVHSANPFVQTDPIAAPPVPNAPDSVLERLLSTAPEGDYLTPAQIAARDAQTAHGDTGAWHLRRGNPKYKEVALTFDDGPHRESTPSILAILDRYHIKATFFVVGQMAAAAPDLIRAEALAGHEIGNHTYHHVNLQKATTVQASEEIEWCNREVESIIARRPATFRPPGGKYDERVMGIARTLGLATVLWTDDPADYASPGTDVIMQRITADVAPGSVILLHDGVDQTILALPPLIFALRNQGYEFVTVSEMLGKLGNGR
jgi:peptidoglycan/xylan/chitin deacetylase (PgdA/CDA1 family)